MTAREREEVYRMRARLGNFIWGGELADLDGPGGRAMARSHHRRIAHAWVAERRREATVRP